MSLTIQTRFANALVDTDLAVPEGLTSWNRARPERRFSVYRNNVAVGLTGALASRFPVAEQIVGPEFFMAMAHAFIAASPPRSPLLLSYGDDFGDFVAHFEPAAEISYLADVIRLEAARGNAYHAADAAPVTAARLQDIDPADLPALRFTPHPSTSVVRSPHPFVTIWAMNAGDIPLAPIENWTAEDALVVRPEMIVNVRRLPPGGAVFVSTLMAGGTLGMAFETAMHETDAFDLAENLAGILQAGAFTHIH